MSVTIGSIRGRGRRVLLVLAMTVGILSLSVFAAARFVGYRLPPCSNSAHISEFEGEYVAYGTFRGGGATYRFEISPERILWWPGVPFDGDASEIGRGRKAVLRQADFSDFGGDDVAIVVPDWSEDVDLVEPVLFENGLLLCVASFCLLRPRRLSAASGASGRFAVVLRGLARAACACLCLGHLLFSLWSGLALAFGIVFFMLSRRRLCRVVAGVGCCAFGVVDASALSGWFGALSGSADWHGGLSAFAPARVLFFLTLALTALAAVGIVAIGVMSLYRRRFEAEAEAQSSADGVVKS